MARRWVVAVAALSLLGASNALAIGYGAYVDVGAGKGTQTVEFDSGDEDFDLDIASVGFGFTLDTLLVRPGPFNYRLSVGFEAMKWEVEREDRGNEFDVDLAGLVITQDLGLTLYRNPRFRLWAGPELRLGIFGGETDEADEDISHVDFGIGPVVGANFALGPTGRTVLSVAGSVLFQGLAGTIDSRDDWDYHGSATMFHLWVSLYHDL